MAQCPNCEAKISADQRFCEKCGVELVKVNAPTYSKVKKVESSKSQAPLTGSKLFDLKRDYYVIKERAWDLGYGDIYDENGNLIGRMNRIIFSIRRRVELLDLDGTLAATIHSKLVSARGAQDLKDPNGILIARIKRKILTFFRHVFYLEDPMGNRWYVAEGNFMGWSFKIFEVSTRKLIAEIEKSDTWKDVFLGGIFDYSDTYALRILDNQIDRRILVGFVLSIDNVLHDTGGGIGPVVGSRPFRGPRYRPGRPRPFGVPRPRR